MYDEKQKAKLIKKEYKRLREIYGELADEKNSPLPGLIERAAFYRISLEELEADIKANGFTEKFSQGDQEPYDRKRPAAEIYNAYSATYLKIIKQLHDMRPKVADNKDDTPDLFEEWRTSRDSSPAGNVSA